MDVSADFLFALFGENSLGTALHNIADAVEFRRLTAQPQLVQLHTVTFKFQRNDGITAAGTGKSCLLGQRAYLDSTLFLHPGFRKYYAVHLRR